MTTPKASLRKCIQLSLVALLATALTASANHPVLLEGETDFDGDGLIGVAEDMDVDAVGFPVFGTLAAALGAASAGANQNGRVTIVTSGRFREAVLITGANGNVTIEAAPGVEANIDAVASGNPGGGNNARQATSGIVINAAADRFITLRNLVVRNWSEGILVMGRSRVLLDNCRIEQNLNYGIYVQGDARVTIDSCKVTSTGYRVGSLGNSPSVVPPNPGVGIQYADQSSGLICRSTVVGNFGAGINVISSAGKKGIQTENNCLFDNNPDFAREKGKDKE